MPLIIAKDLESWAQNIEAPSDLPRLIRRLMTRAPGITWAIVPAGTSVRKPGWDGAIDCHVGNAWVPAGRSYWEMSCRADVSTKANEDYKKRLQETAPEERTRAVFLFVTARNWSGKAVWVATAKSKGEWADVRAYDADDIEHWLEHEPRIALAFAEELGRRGPGVESPESYWTAWSAKAIERPKPKSIFLGRESTRDALVEKLRRQQGPSEGQLVIHADSVEEATAFACATVMGEEALAACSIVVTTETGWRFVHQDERTIVAFAASMEAARAAPARAGLLTVIPIANGDVDRIRMEGEIGGRTRDAFILPRQDGEHFENALVGLGVDANEARRLASITGRSWSVFLRQRSQVPEIQRPPWRNDQDSKVLIALCLVGGWNADRKADREVVEAVATIPYAEVEISLGRLAQANDPPVLRIGQVWKAKSAVELLSICGAILSVQIVDKFFEIVTAVLSATDPELELPAGERWRAGSLGKQRPQSDLLIASMLDGVVKLSVRGAELGQLQHLRLSGRAEALVKDLLSDANALRWLSLNGHLAALGEAAPRAFLAAAEKALTQDDAPLRELFTESDKASGLGGRFYHTGLLWALEVLAWAPERTRRIVDILAALHTHDNETRGNSAIGSLHDILRPWMPQTAATSEQRKAFMRSLAATQPDAAFDLFMRMVPYDQTGNYTARPNWRQDDVGTTEAPTNKDVWECYAVAADEALRLARGNARRTARVIPLLGYGDKAKEMVIFENCQLVTQPPHNDPDRELVRNALRHRIHALRNYNREEEIPDRESLAECDRLFVELAPQDMVLRHRWLFVDDFPALPEHLDQKDRYGRGSRTDQARGSALAEIFSAGAMLEVTRLAQVAHAGLVGFQAAQTDGIAATAMAWAIDHFADNLKVDWFRIFVGALVRGLPEATRGDLSQRINEASKRFVWTREVTTSFLALFPSNPRIWELARQLNVHELYWRTMTPNYWLRDDETSVRQQEIDFLLEARRPRTAFSVGHMMLAKVQPERVAALLEATVRGEEEDGPLLQAWDINKAIEILEEANCLDEMRLASLEFALLPIHGEGIQVKALMRTVTTNPAVFVELLSLIYRTKGEDDLSKPIDEGRRQTALRSWQLLHRANRVPGTRTDGSIDEVELTQFVDQCRKWAAEKGILAQCEAALGTIISHAPAGADGIWPCEAVRAVLDRPGIDSLHNGFVTGVINLLGMTSRGVFDGGNIERDRAKFYRNQSVKLGIQYPRLSEALDGIATEFESWARLHDNSARLRREGR